VPDCPQGPTGRPCREPASARNCPHDLPGVSQAAPAAARAPSRPPRWGCVADVVPAPTIPAPQRTGPARPGHPPVATAGRSGPTTWPRARVAYKVLRELGFPTISLCGVTECLKALRAYALARASSASRLFAVQRVRLRASLPKRSNAAFTPPQQRPSLRPRRHPWADAAWFHAASRTESTSRARLPDRRGLDWGDSYMDCVLTSRQPHHSATAERESLTAARRRR